MGAWGYKPFENDTALDFMGGIADMIAEKALRAKEPEAFLAGVYALSLLGGAGVIDSAHGKRMTKRLAALSKNKEWLERWVDGGKGSKKAIDGLLKELESMAC